MSTADILTTRIRHHASSTPDKTAVILDNHHLTFSELVRISDQLAAGLFSLGVRPGDHLGVALPTCIECALLFPTAARLGITLVPVSPSLPADALRKLFDAADVRHIIASRHVLSDLLQLSPAERGHEKALHISVGSSLPGTTSWDEVLARGADTSLPPDLRIPETQPFILTMTSGSTGDPKPIILSQKTKELRALSAQELYGVTSSDVTLAATPLYHSLAMRLLLLPLLTGGTAVIMPRYSPSEWVRTVKEQRVTFSIAVSSQLKQILETLQTSKEEVSTLRCIVSSSALLEDTTKAALVDFLKCEFHECYGASEIAIATNLSPSAPREKLKSVGEAIPHSKIEIIGEDGNPLPHGQIGEIVCETPLLFSGYYKRADATTAAMWGPYFRTGDLGFIDTDGYLTFVGRKKEVIITGGLNVYPKDIEDTVLKLPEILECAAVAVPDAHLGEVVGLAVVPRQEAQLTVKSIQRFCASLLADYQQPHHYRIVPELPRNAMGKVMKLRVKELFEGVSTKTP